MYVRVFMHVLTYLLNFAISGYLTVFIYTTLMLGKFNCVQQRAGLAIAGFLGVIMGIVVSFGICSAFGLFFSSMHSVLPFLLLGIGLDDMFVIAQCFDNLEIQQKKRDIAEHGSENSSMLLPLPERMGNVLSHGGVTITITSITDIIAFGVGGSTVLPALSSFCIYASVGIIATYFFQCTFFVACMTLDIRRAEENRNACCPMISHNNEWTPNECSQANYIQRVFKWYGKCLTTIPGKVCNF